LTLFEAWKHPLSRSTLQIHYFALVASGTIDFNLYEAETDLAKLDLRLATIVLVKPLASLSYIPKVSDFSRVVRTANPAT
jgi:hypothetical protein